MALSKSKYTTFRQCQKALWLKSNKPESAEIDPSVQARLEAGTNDKQPDSPFSSTVASIPSPWSRFGRNWWK